MGKQTTFQNAFIFGEVSPRAFGRYDTEKPIWKYGLAKQENFLNFKLGGSQFWPGTTYIANTKNPGDKIRLQPLSYASDQQYMTEWGNQYLRFYANRAKLVLTYVDPIDSFTKLLCHFDTDFSDSSSSAHTLTSVNSATIQTDQYKFGGGAVAFNSGTGYITIPDSADWDFSGGVWTVDTWILPTGLGVGVTVFSQATDGNNLIECYVYSDGNIYLVVVASGVQTVSFHSTSSPVNVNQWNHIEVVENGNNYYIMVNGVIVATTSSANRPANYTGTFRIGKGTLAGNFNGYMDEFRVSNGVARNTTNFTPFTLPYGTIALWITSHSYSAGDYVIENSTIYRCVIAHTSGTFATDLAAGDWIADVTYEIATPYPIFDVFGLQFAGKQDVTYVVSPARPQKLSRLGAVSFTLTPVQTIRGPFMDANVSATTITPSSATGATTLTASTPIFKSSHIGAIFRINSDATHGAVVLITAYTSPTVVVGTIQVEPDGVTAGDIGGTSGYTNWAEGAFSDYRGWPDSVTFHEQRLVYGMGDKFYGSVSGAYDNFNNGAQLGGTIVDTDSYSYQLATDQASTSIRWVSSNTTLQIGTTAGTFTAQGSTSGITPTAIQVTPDTDYSVFATQPDKLASYLYYLDANTFTVRQLVFSLELNKQKAVDVTRLADHILRDGMGGVQTAHQHNPNDRLWIPRVDGQMAVLTEDASEQITAWARRTGGATALGAGLFESVGILGQDGADDDIWVSVQRNVNGTIQRFIEIFNSEFPINYYDYNNLDASLTYDTPIVMSAVTKANPGVITATAHGLSNGNQIKIDNVVGMTQLNQGIYLVANATTNTLTLTDLASNPINTTAYGTYLSGGQIRLMQQTFTGLDYLDGEVVYAQVDGVGSLTQYTVSGGSITLGTKAAVVHVGLKYTGSLQLLPLNPQTKLQKIYLATVRLFKSIGGKISSVDQYGNIKGALPIPYASSDNPLYTANVPYSGDVEMPPDSDYNKYGSILIQQDTPNPLFILSTTLVNEANEK